jgi:hypothetical protein
MWKKKKQSKPKYLLINKHYLNKLIVIQCTTKSGNSYEKYYNLFIYLVWIHFKIINVLRINIKSNFLKKLWCSQFNGNHPKKKLAKFGYKPYIKNFRKYKYLFMFLDTY